ncbi:hypothetical protein KAFR_0I01020 [Kazachstania africana CBS 2517]|uniref:Phospholipid/glycerol acyltransferase domain-containing protein n=1 Tax=Kazachstania africana (strain ATCC 22294 / BCRC 22015 / CBS 2517 / CECT 1963 / NBRC 1671 / NRRL Y-8276) TaxID=1071382 RepID=H2AZT3_KAZAF|nr:hypothetical protein KAFR_0I01020 [Kazachstania africana CBS 2517]CCF59883.1 hypothetical protein KAFR_0I01020 [Kazachstania africana CBS 2517]
MEKPLSAKKVEQHDPSFVKDDKCDIGYEEPSKIRKYIYDCILWILSTTIRCFFREIRTRGGFKIPKEGPVIFVAAPHANQFIDPVILMDQVKLTVDRRVSFLIAESSLKQMAIGFFARCVMAIGVVRPQDNLKFIEGKVTIDPSDNRKIIGHGTHFLRDCKPKGLIGLSKASLGFVEIQSIESDTELTVRKEFKMNKPSVKHALSKGSIFKYASKVDQSLVYHKVFEHLANNGSIGIFPEGGSHDRTDLLPLKAGVAIMALGCMNKHPDVNVKIVPCGMNYFHAHKFRSRCVIEFGDPIEISKDLVAKYHNPETNREAVKTLLDTITEGLKSVTVTCPDYETLMVVQAMRRLYSTQFSGKLPLSLVVEMNRRLVKGYETFKDDDELIQLKKSILTYNSHLSHYNIPDHLVETAKINFMKNLSLLIFRSIRITLLLVLALPGIIMFSPVFILSKRISEQKARTALAKSLVKIKANDVVATWKVLISMGFAPLLYIFWSVLVTYYFRESPIGNVLTFLVSYLLCATVTYSALLVGDIGMDILKSLRPLYLSLTSPNGFKELQKERRLLTAQIVDTVNSFSSDALPDFEEEILFNQGTINEEEEDRKTSELKRRRLLRKKKKEREQRMAQQEEEEAAGEHEHAQESDAISLVNSDNSLSNIPLFSNTSGYKSESSLTSYPVSRDSTSGFESDISVEKIVSKGAITSKIAEAILRERNKAEEENQE